MKLSVTVAIIIVIALQLGAGCQIVVRGEVQVSPGMPYRCGHYESHIYVRSPIVEDYPDLGVILANSELLQLSAYERKQIETKAIECAAICEGDLNSLRLLEDDLKGRISINEMEGNMSEVAIDLNRIQAKKMTWLRNTKKCYQEGLLLLSHDSLVRWLPNENKFKPFP